MRPIESQMPPARRPARAPVLSLVAALSLLSAGEARAVQSVALKAIRGQYEGLDLRLRVDLDRMTGAKAPNVVSLDGIGHGREGAPVLFGRMERVYLERIVNDGAARVELTIYTSRQEASRLRASNIPQPSMSNPNLPQTLASFAQLSSTSLLLELKADKRDPEAQTREIETLLDRVFYLKSEPTVDELYDFVRQHAGLSIQRLRDLTGLDSATIRGLIEERPAATPSPPRP
jgi:hypothetical protein